MMLHTPRDSFLPASCEALQSPEREMGPKWGGGQSLAATPSRVTSPDSVAMRAETRP